MEVEAPCAGALLKVMADEGAEVQVGAPVCRIEQA